MASSDIEQWNFYHGHSPLNGRGMEYDEGHLEPDSMSK